MHNFVLGQYVPGDSYLYKLDPRVKIIGVLLLMISVFLLKNITQVLIALGFIVLILISGRISLFRVLKGLKPLIVLLLFTFFFQIFFNKEGRILYETNLHFGIYSILIALGALIIWYLLKSNLGHKGLFLLLVIGALFVIFKFVDFGKIFYTYHFEVPESGVKMAVFIMVRLIIVISLATILTLTTKPTDINLGLESLMKPLKYIKLKPEEYALIISIALRYIPTILDEANKIMQAQTSRGSDFSESGLGKKIVQIVSLLVPMFIIAFQRSDDLACAMEARSFVPGRPRTKLFELKWKYKDTLALLFLFIVLGGCICVRIFL